MPYTLTVLAFLQSLSVTADHIEKVSASDITVTTTDVYSGNTRMSIPDEFIAPNSSRLDIHSCLIVCIWPGLNSTSEVRLGIPSRLTRGEFYINILIQEKNNISDPEKQFENYISFNKDLTQSNSVFGLEYKKSLSPTVRDVFVSRNSGDFIFSRCEKEDVRHPSCLLTMSRDGFVIQLGFPRSELWNWKEMEDKVGQLVRSWIR